MTLAAPFLASVPEARRARFASLSDLDAALAALVAKGRAAWPEIPLSPEDFVAFLGRGLPEDVAERLPALRGDDLWLVCAFGLGLPGAAEALDDYAFASLARALGRLGASPELIADLSQDLRSRLLEMRTPRPDQKIYAGNGGLRSWLRVSAVREMNRRRRRRVRELSLDERPLLVASPEPEPELALLLKTHKRALTQAFREALASLSTRERNVLRYHFVEGLSIDRVAALYDVHRATAARWVNHAREALFTRTRALFRERVSMSDEGFQRIVVLLESQIGVHLADARAP